MMKKQLVSIIAFVAIILLLQACSSDTDTNSSTKSNGELEGEIVFWHSFTQGPRKEYMQEAADDFMEKHPGVKIKIETFAWSEFYTKWTTGFTSGQVPDVSTALPNHVVEMLNYDAIVPLNETIDKIGRNRFYEASLMEGTVEDKNYSIPLYSHAQVMWYRKDLLKEAGVEVPQTWDELYKAAVAVTEKTDAYGLSVPMGTGDMMATRFLNFYVRSAGKTLITDNGKANLTNDTALEGIRYWVKMYKATSPKGSVNYNVLDQANLFYQGDTAFDFNSGFHISGVKSNSPQLLKQIKAAPIPKIKEDGEKNGIETSNIPLVVWKNSEHQKISKAFVKSLFETERYINFLHSVPGGMLPALKDIAEKEEYLNNETIQQFEDSIDVITKELEMGTAIGMENGPQIEAGFLTSQGVIEEMFQEIVVSGKPVEEAAKKAEEKLNRIFESN